MLTTCLTAILAAVTVGLVLAGMHPIAAIAIALLIGVGTSLVLAVIGMRHAEPGSSPGSTFLAGLREGLTPLTDIFGRRKP